jgi:hypothetical protein
MESPALCPLDRVETEIVPHLRIGARIQQQSYEFCVAEYDGEDEGRLTAVCSFVYVRAASQQRGHSPFITGGNGVG